MKIVLIKTVKLHSEISIIVWLPVSLYKNFVLFCLEFCFEHLLKKMFLLSILKKMFLLT